MVNQIAMATTTATTTIQEESTPPPPPETARDKIIYSDFHYYAPPPDGPGVPSVNDLELILGTKDQETVRLPVHDLRGREGEFTIDRNGFQILQHVSKMGAGGWDDDDVIEAVYWKEVEEIVRGLL